MATDQLELAVVPADALSPAMRSAIVAVCTDALQSDCGTLFEYLSGSEHILASIAGGLVGHACWTTRSLAPADREPPLTAWDGGASVPPSCVD